MTISTQRFRIMCKLFTCLILLFCESKCLHAWEKPGCNLVGHERTVQLPGCVAFDVKTAACRGYCESYAIPSPYRTLIASPTHIITSRANCCSITETQDVNYFVLCEEGLRNLTFKSAKKCECSVCRR